MALGDIRPQELMTRPKRSQPADDSPPPTKAEILEDIRIGLRQAKDAEGMPARAVLDEIRAELASDADHR